MLFVRLDLLPCVESNNLVRHPTPPQKFLFLSRKKRLHMGFEPGSPTMNPECALALDRSPMEPVEQQVGFF